MSFDNNTIQARASREANTVSQQLIRTRPSKEGKYCLTKTMYPNESIKRSELSIAFYINQFRLEREVHERAVLTMTSNYVKGRRAVLPMTNPDHNVRGTQCFC